MTVQIKDANGSTQTVATADDIIATLNAQAVASGNPASPSPNILSVLDNTAQLRVAPVTVTAVGVLFTQDLAGNGRQYQTVVVDVSSIPAGATLAFEGSNDNTNWYGVSAWKSDHRGDGGQEVLTINSGSAAGLYIVHCPFGAFRVRCTGYTSGNVTAGGFFTKGVPPRKAIVAEGPTGSGGTPAGNPLDNASRAAIATPVSVGDGQLVRQMADKSGRTVTKPFSPADLDWAYAAAAGGIVNSSAAVTVKAAVAATRQFMTSLDFAADALGAATELAVRSTGGAVLWRTKIGTAGNTGRDIVFATPLQSLSGEGLEVVTLTASVTGGVYVNAQGYSGA